MTMSARERGTIQAVAMAVATGAAAMATGAGAAAMAVAVETAEVGDTISPIFGREDQRTGLRPVLSCFAP